MLFYLSFTSYSFLTLTLTPFKTTMKLHKNYNILIELPFYFHQIQERALKIGNYNTTYHVIVILVAEQYFYYCFILWSKHNNNLTSTRAHLYFIPRSILVPIRTNPGFLDLNHPWFKLYYKVFCEVFCEVICKVLCV